MLKLYNTLSRKKEEFKPIEGKKVRFYHCGPTVYWVQHIGNMRAMVMADLINRSLRYLDYDVTLVRNYTDVGHLVSDEDEGEDKMEKGAKREGLSPQEIADKYIKSFEDHTSALNVIEPDHKPKATEFINEMIKIDQELINKGYAYETPKAVYFDVSKFPNYTELSRQKIDENESGAGTGDVSDPNKKNPHDFSLWFFKTGPHKNALQHWHSPFNSSEVENGEGFPGWHIECSAMAISLLGETLDIHMGGIEHIPVHHTNEIAQSESYTGKRFSNFWLHNEHLNVDGGKMSKSAGTSYTVDDIRKKGYDPIVLRYFFLQSHYRSKQNFTWEALEASSVAYNRLLSKLKELWSEGGSRVDQSQVDDNFKQQFIEVIEDDINVPQALALTWDVLKSNLSNEIKLATIFDFDRVLGLKLEEKTREEIELPDEVKELLDQRAAARSSSDWTKSDEIRKQLEQQFEITVEDTPDGQRVKRLE